MITIAGTDFVQRWQGILESVSDYLNAAFPALRAALAVGLMVTVLLGTAVAGPYEDGVEAYQRGDYAAVMRLVRPLANQGNAMAQYYDLTESNRCGNRFEHALISVIHVSSPILYNAQSLLIRRTFGR